MSQIINIGGFDIYLKKKNIKNIHLSIHPPLGEIKISAPKKMEDDGIKSFILLKLDWIKKNRKKIILQERETPRELLNGESFFIWGERFLLNHLSSKEQKSVYIKNKNLIINLDFKADFKKKQFLLEKWFRSEVRKYAEVLVNKWSKKLNVTPEKVYVRRMLTKWGSCNTQNNSIRLNTELIHKPKFATEYIVVHELLHFLEPKHSKRFFEILDKLLPNWRKTKQLLNELPISYLTSKKLY